MPRAPTKPTTSLTESPVARFEQSLVELEQLVARMEGGEMGLDESLASFERGIALYRGCQSALEQAEARVKALLGPSQPEETTGNAGAGPVAADADDEDIPF